MGKYIIDIEEGKEGVILCQTGIVAVGLHLNDEDSLKSLGIKSAIPYIEPSRGEIYKNAYQKGLSDAWDAARWLAKSNAGINFKIFGWHFTNEIVQEISASEAIDKIQQYEQKHEEQIQVGDEVIDSHARIGVCTGFSGSDEIYVMWRDGSSGNWDKRQFDRTGMHYPEIAEVLKKM